MLYYRNYYEIQQNTQYLSNFTVFQGVLTPFHPHAPLCPPLTLHGLHFVPYFYNSFLSRQDERTEKETYYKRNEKPNAKKMKRKA